MGNRSSPLLAAGKMPSLPANFMLLCVAMVTPSQRTPAGSLCVRVCVSLCVFVYDREGDGQMDRERADGARQ